jgi:hypothetical protein
MEEILSKGGEGNTVNQRVMLRIQYLNGQLYAEISIFALSASILNKTTRNFYNMLYDIKIMCTQNLRAICEDTSEREPFEPGQLRNNQNHLYTGLLLICRSHFCQFGFTLICNAIDLGILLSPPSTVFCYLLN